jgi:hypothetical protein
MKQLFIYIIIFLHIKLVPQKKKKNQHVQKVAVSIYAQAGVYFLMPYTQFRFGDTWTQFLPAVALFEQRNTTIQRLRPLFPFNSSEQAANSVIFLAQRNKGLILQHGST